MILLGLTLLFLLQVEGIRQDTALYHRPGNNVLLPCLSLSPDETRCSSVDWLNSKDSSVTTTDVRNGKINQNSVRAARLRLHSNCSLIINNITAEDATSYTCRLYNTVGRDTRVYLNILTISSSPDPKSNGEVRLTCTLWRDHRVSCADGSFHWMNETGSVLDGAGDGFRFLGQTNCVSHLSVKRHSEHSRRFTCQYVEDSSVKIKGHYSTLGTVTPSTGTATKTPMKVIVIGAVCGSLVMLLVITIVLIKCHRRAKVTEDGGKTCSLPEDPGLNMTYATVSRQPGAAETNDEAEGNVTYASVNIASQKKKVKEKKKKKEEEEEKEEEVTYSAVRAR